MDLEERNQGYIGGLRKREGKWEICNYINLKVIINIK